MAIFKKTDERSPAFRHEDRDTKHSGAVRAKKRKSDYLKYIAKKGKKKEEGSGDRLKRGRPGSAVRGLGGEKPGFRFLRGKRREKKAPEPELKKRNARCVERAKKRLQSALS